jgi:hypothetical protein
VSDNVEKRFETDIYIYTVYIYIYRYRFWKSGFGGLEVAYWPLVLKFAGSHPAEAVGSSARLFFGGKIKPSVPCRSFTACKRSINVKW